MDEHLQLVKPIDGAGADNRRPGEQDGVVTDHDA